jgi:uncharacterized beta barrel domain-containing protein DUF5777
MRNRTRLSTPAWLFVWLCALSTRAWAAPLPTPDPQGQNPPAASAAPAGQAPAGGTQVATEDDDAVLDPIEPDLVIVNLPTTMRVPLHKGNFRLTHRFVGNLRQGTFSENASNLFGLDQGAIIGFEYRMAVMRHLEAAAYRTNFNKTIQLYAKYDAIHQTKTMPVSVSALGSEEGTNNFQDVYSPAVGAVVSRKFAGRVAAYVVPMWVHNTAGIVGEETRDTMMLGLGGRLRVVSSVTVVGEYTPRVAGYAPGDSEYGFGLEKRVGGHVFQLTFTNTTGSTFAQLARGGQVDTLYLGFNLSRKFF